MSKRKNHKQPSPQIRVENYAVPFQVMQQYKEVTLSADVMKITGIPFLMTISKRIKFGTAGKLLGCIFLFTGYFFFCQKSKGITEEQELLRNSLFLRRNSSHKERNHIIVKKGK